MRKCQVRFLGYKFQLRVCVDDWLYMTRRGQICKDLLDDFELIAGRANRLNAWRCLQRVG